jgi:outer membrane autotransporter protein
VITGNVDLDASFNVFNNWATGTFNSGPTVKLGTAGTLNDGGDLSPDSKGVVQRTALSGNLVQTSSGKLTVDVDRVTGQADRLDVTGTAQLAGQVVVNAINPSIVPGATSFTIVHADGGLTDNGLTLVQSASAIASSQLQFSSPNDVVLETSINFAPSGLNSNQRRIGQNINAVQNAGSLESFSPITQALIGLPDTQTLGRAYDQLSPETYAYNEISDFYFGSAFCQKPYEL